MNREHHSPPSRINAEVLKLGLVSLLTDLSSEGIFSVFAVFFTTVKGGYNFVTAMFY